MLNNYYQWIIIDLLNMILIVVLFNAVKIFDFSI